MQERYLKPPKIMETNTIKRNEKMKHLKVTQATIENLDELASLFNEYRVFYGQESDLDGAKQFLFERTRSLESIIFLVFNIDEQRAIGFTQLYPSFSSVSMKRTWILNDLYVIEQYRKQGVAKLLLDAAKTYAIKTKAKGLGLSTAIDNHIAQRLYEKNGYKKDTEYYHYFFNV
jgi:ribosomal protein S18 acetylase RimI-like enzyme